MSMNLSIDIPGFTQTSSRPQEWTPIYPAHANNIYKRMVTDNSFMRGLHRKWSFTRMGGFKIEGMNLSAEGMQRVEEFLWNGLLMITGFGLVPVFGRILENGDLVPIVPDFSSGGFLWALSKRHHQVLTAWGLREGDGSTISKRPDPQTRVFVAHRPGYMHPIGFDSIFARLLSELSFRQEVVENYLAADFSRTHPVDYVHHLEERRHASAGERGSANTKSTVHKNLFQDLAFAEEQALTLSEMSRAHWTKNTMGMEERSRDRDFMMNTASQLTRRTAFDPSGNMVLIDREKSSVNRVPMPPGWQATASSRLSASDRIIEMKEAYDNMVMLALGLPPDGFLSRRRRDPTEGFGSSSGKGDQQSWSKESVQVMTMVQETRNLLSKLFDYFIEEFWYEETMGKASDGSGQRYDHVMSENTAAIEAVRMAVARMITELKSGDVEEEIVSRKDDAAAEQQDLERAKKGETAPPAKKGKEEQIIDLASYLQHLLNNDLLQTEGIFQDEIQNAEMRLEDEISAEVAEISREIYMQASNVSLALSEENIREMVMQSPQIKAKLEVLDGNNKSKAKGQKGQGQKGQGQNDQKKPHIVWLEPPAYSPDTLNGLAANGLLNKRAYVRMVLQYQRLPTEMVKELMDSVKYEEIMKVELDAKKPKEAAAPKPKDKAGADSSSSKEKRKSENAKDKPEKKKAKKE